MAWRQRGRLGACQSGSTCKPHKERDGLAVTGRGIVYGGSSLFALAVLVGGLETLADDPIAGVLLALAGMALSLYGVAGTCGAYLSRRE